VADAYVPVIKMEVRMKELKFRTVSLNSCGSFFHLALTILLHYRSSSSFILGGGSPYLFLLWRFSVMFFQPMQKHFHKESKKS
jgi:Na+/pantothenate symporter